MDERQVPRRRGSAMVEKLRGIVAALLPGKRRLLVATMILSTLYIGAVWLAPQHPFLLLLAEKTWGSLIPARVYAGNLNSQDNEMVRSTFWLLTRRKSPVALTRAAELLESPHDYVWADAALYLAACGQREAVPYLIKALRHTAYGYDGARVDYLRSLTGQDFGTDFVRWQQWWLAEHPDSPLDWTSHLGPSPRMFPPPRAGCQ